MIIRKPLVTMSPVLHYFWYLSDLINKGIYSLSIIFVILSGVTGCKSAPKSTPFEVGVEITDITPTADFPIYRGKSTGVDNKLYARALVFKQGDVKGAVLLCDLLTIPRNLSRIVREKVSNQTSIPFQNITITATHSHTTPSNRAAISLYAEREATGKLTEEDQQGYISKLIKGMTDAIVLADQKTQETELTVGKGRAEGLSFNRRYLMTNGRIAWNPGCLNPRIVHPAGPIDPDVHFILFRPKAQDNYNASLTVFANHLDTQGGTDFSVDYPYFLHLSLKQLFGEQLISVFGTGPCGNINHIDVSKPRPSDRKAVTEKIGRTLAEAVKLALPYAKQYEPDLKVISKTIYLPLQDYTNDDLIWAKENEKTLATLESPTGKLSFMESVRMLKIISLEEIRQNEAIPPVVSGEPWRFPVEIHVFRLNAETAVITMPGEIFVEHGLALKERSPFANTILIELANSDIRYVPTRSAYAEGAYEPLQSRLAPGSGEAMIEEALQILENIAIK